MNFEAEINHLKDRMARVELAAKFLINAAGNLADATAILNGKEVPGYVKAQSEKLALQSVHPEKNAPSIAADVISTSSTENISDTSDGEKTQAPVPLKKDVKRGPNLSLDKKRMARSMHHQGISIQKIADFYEVPIARIESILNDRSIGYNSRRDTLRYIKDMHLNAE